MKRINFNSNFGFILAASGSAVGLGNIWGFPTMVANNGGGAYVLMYLVMVLLLAFPVLLTELIIGNYAQSNQVDALHKISGNRKISNWIGYGSATLAALILSFYAIVGGWMIAYSINYLLKLFGIDFDLIIDLDSNQKLIKNIITCGIFSGVTALIIAKGINKGVELWSKRLMPTLLVILIALIIYVGMQAGAKAGYAHYLIPDFSKIWDSSLMINAMSQAFFSLSLGVGTMLVYGSYIKPNNNIVKLGVSVAVVDVTIAFLAGMLIIPAMFVALNSGIGIMQNGQVIGGPGVVLQVLPELFKSLVGIEQIIALAFFILLVLASITSSISMLEVPCSVVSEKFNKSKAVSAYSIASIIFVISIIIITNSEALFDLVIKLTTNFGQPLMGLIFCLIAGWMWQRGELLKTLKQGNPKIENTLFWKVWPIYIRYICPVLILLMIIQSFK